MIDPADRPTGLYGLVWVVDRLLGPEGCPWDKEQTHASLHRYLLEEAYELIDAIDSGVDSRIREELGDVLLQPVLHAQIAKQRTADTAEQWDTDSVAETICEKLIRRHPHVFGDVAVETADEVLRNWDAIKATEKDRESPGSLLEGVPRAMPGMARAYEVSRRAARAGFEWPHLNAVFDKLHEEEAELRSAVDSGDAARVEAEVGDLLFTAVNVARWAGVDPEQALRLMLDRFTDRFQHMERAADKPLRELGADEWDALWNSAKDC